MISVCMATFNGAKYIKEQIDSILKQLSSEDELIISDDTSTDGTVDIIESYQDSRIKLFRFIRDKRGLKPINLVTTNFENALKHVKGDIIILSDQDDVWTDYKVYTIRKYLEDGNLDYIVSDCYVVDSQLNMINDTRFNGSVTKNRWKALLSPTPYQGSCAAFNRKVLNKALPFPKGIQSHDRWIGYIASFGFNYKIIPEKLIYYRRHELTTSNANIAGKKSGSIPYKIRTRLKYIYELLKRL